jgi:hypothetical protein
VTEPEPLAPASLRAEVVEETRQLADRLDTEGPAALGHYRVTRFIPRPDGTADRVVTEPACELTASLKSGLAVRARLLAEMADLKPQLARTAARVEAHVQARLKAEFGLPSMVSAHLGGRMSDVFDGPAVVRVTHLGGLYHGPNGWWRSGFEPGEPEVVTRPCPVDPDRLAEVLDGLAAELGVPVVMFRINPPETGR